MLNPAAAKTAAALVAAELDRPLPGAATAMAEAIRARHGAALLACLFYGSCLRDGVVEGRVLDFYAVASNYRSFHGRRLPALLNRLLPPNVYYIETEHEGRRLRAKYAVVSLADLGRDSSARAVQPTLWARLAQPCALAWARDGAVRKRMVAALAEAAGTTLAAALPLMPVRFSARAIWVRAFAESYRTELRSESGNRPEVIVDAAPERYARLAELVLPALGAAAEEGKAGDAARFRHEAAPGPARRAARRWRRRRWLGRVLHVLRLAKAAYTFSGGLDYILWKIESHSGVRAEPTPWQRRHPLIAAPGLAWRLYRRGAFR